MLDSTQFQQWCLRLAPEPARHECASSKPGRSLRAGSKGFSSRIAFKSRDILAESSTYQSTCRTTGSRTRYCGNETTAREIQEVLFLRRSETFSCTAHTSSYFKTPVPECGAMWTARIQGDRVLFPPHPPRSTRVAQAVPRWIKQGATWTPSDKNKELGL